MLKRIFILLGVLHIQTICGREESRQKSVEEPKLDNKPYGIADAIQTTKELIEGQRQKRFYDYSYVGYNTGSSAFSSVIPTFPNYGDSYTTNVPNEQKRLNEILRRLEHIADLTRVLHVPPLRRPQIPFYIPVHSYLQGCTCPPNEPTARPDAQTKPPATYLPPATSTEKGIPDLGNRSGEDSKKTDVSDDYDDGVRPISFDPIPPKRPQSVAPPPVEHGSFQAGLDPAPPGFSASAPPQNELPQSPPTVCDGAILACCHRPDVRSDCFAKEGCGELEHDNPCEPKVLLNIVNKFRAHFNKRG